MAATDTTATTPAANYNPYGTATAATATATPVTQATPAVAGQATVAAPLAVDPNSTVAGQVKGLIDANSPLMQQAQAKALQASNARGLINSSQAVGAGQDAVLSAALPIAQQDASTNFQAATGNFNAENTDSIQNAQNTTSVNQANLNANTQTNLATAQGANQAALANAQGANTISAANLTAGTQAGVANTEANYKINQQLQASVAGLQSNYTAQRSSIMQNATMDAASKTTALAALDNQYKSDVNMLGSVAGIDVSPLLVGV